MKRTAKYRKGHVGSWVLLGKIYTKRANCYLCNKEIRGEQLIYTHLMTKEKIAICQLCVRKFEHMNNNPVNQKLLDEYNKEEKRAKKVYIKVLSETGSHKEAFNAENKIITDAQNRYESMNSNPIAKRKKFILVSVSNDISVSDKVYQQYKRKYRKWLNVPGIGTWSWKKKLEYYNKTGIII